MSDLRCPTCGYVHHGGTESDVAIWRDEGCFNGCTADPVWEQDTPVGRTHFCEPHSGEMAMDAFGGEG